MKTADPDVLDEEPERKKYNQRKEENTAVSHFLEWCNWHGITLVGPDPFYGKPGHSHEEIDLYRSVSVEGVPFEAVWCEYIGVDFEKWMKEEERRLSKLISEGLSQAKKQEEQ